MPAVLVVDIDTLFHSQNAFSQGRLHDREPPLGGVCIPQPSRSASSPSASLSWVESNCWMSSKDRSSSTSSKAGTSGMEN